MTMNSSPWLWLALNLASILMLSFYSMMEMACVSFNQIRLQYYLTQNNSRAARLNYLLQRPSYLFGTTLIGVNVAMVFGSEFARQFHAAIGISPDWAPLTQVMLVVIFGELAPMFAARRYAEHMVMLGINLLYFSSILMTPLLWTITGITKLVQLALGSRYEAPANPFFSQEEVQKILEEHDEEKGSASLPQDFNTIVSNIFALRGKKANQVMTLLANVPSVPSTCTVGEMRNILRQKDHPFLLITHQRTSDVIGLAFPRDLIREPDNRRVREEARQPWFISHETEIIHILAQFRRNNQTVAIVLNDKGKAVGVLTLEDVVEEIFGQSPWDLPLALPSIHPTPMLELTVPGNMKIKEFNHMYHVHLDPQGVETFSDLMIKVLGHHPEAGEVIYLPPFELQAKEVALLEVEFVTIKTKAS